MSHSSRRILLGAVLAGCFFVGSLAPAASEAKVTNQDLLKMDKKILETNGQILDQLGETQDLLGQLGLGGDVDLSQLLGTVNELNAKLNQVLSIVQTLGGTLDEVLSLVGNLGNNLNQVLGLVSPLTCQLLGICPTGSSP
jgi:hypothetical protein